MEEILPVPKQGLYAKKGRGCMNLASRPSQVANSRNLRYGGLPPNILDHEVHLEFDVSPNNPLRLCWSAAHEIYDK